MTDKLLKVKDVAERLQFSRQGIFNLIQQNKLPKPLKIGRSLRWRPESVEEFLKEKETECS